MWHSIVFACMCTLVHRNSLPYGKWEKVYDMLSAVLAPGRPNERPRCTPFPTLGPARPHPSLHFACPRGPRLPDDAGFSRALQHVQHLIYFYNIQMKHLQRTSETAETFATSKWNTYVAIANICKHQDETLATCVWNIYKTPEKLENTCAIANICKHQHETLTTYVRKHQKHLHIYATSRSNFTTSEWNTCNICLKQMKYLEHALETYVYSPLQHVQYPYKTLATYL
jgi:hypothetical protein